MIRARTLMLVLLLTLSSAALAVTTTVKFALTNTAWTDLGPGPLLLSFKGSGVFAIADTTPSIPLGEGFTMISGDSFYVSSTSHVWAMTQGVAGVIAYVAAY